MHCDSSFLKIMEVPFKLESGAQLHRYVHLTFRKATMVLTPTNLFPQILAPNWRIPGENQKASQK
jgi:hypothetical protein